MAESNIYHGQTKLDSSPHMITNPIKQGTYFARVHFFGRILFRFNSPNHHLLRLCCQKNPELVSTKINVAWFPHWLMTMVLPVASMQQNTAFGKTSPAASATESQARCVFSVNRLLCIQSLIWLITKTINSFIHVARNIQSWWANEYFGLWSVHDTGEGQVTAATPSLHWQRCVFAMSGLICFCIAMPIRLTKMIVSPNVSL